jgi:hypothetical protein
MMNPDRVKYWNAFNCARERGIPFLFSFEEWLKFWIESGHYHEIGPFKGQYCMARNGDKGPYVRGNVRICTVSENHKEKRHKQAHKDKLKGNKFAAGNTALCGRKRIEINGKIYYRHVITTADLNLPPDFGSWMHL